MLFWVVSSTMLFRGASGIPHVDCGANLGESFLVGEGFAHVMHWHDRMGMGTRIPTMPGWSTSGFDRPGTGIACIEREAPSSVG